MLSILIFILAIAGAAVGAGGGGGGGGGGASSSGGAGGSSIPSENSFIVNNKTNNPSWIVSESEANVYRSVEYNRQWGLEAIHAAEAYAALNKNNKEIAGDGVKIGVSDSGAQTSHADLSANIDLVNRYNYISNNTNVTDTNGHEA